MRSLNRPANCGFCFGIAHYLITGTWNKWQLFDPKPVFSVNS
jgi:hypothetical protein